MPGNPSTDNGCDEVTALNYRENNGAQASHGEVYTVVSTDGINKASQKAPNGFDWSQLTADFDSMGGSVSPPTPSATSR